MVVSSYNDQRLHASLWVPVMEEDFIIYSDSLDESVALFETADESSLNTKSRQKLNINSFLSRRV